MWNGCLILSLFIVVCYGGTFYSFDVKGNSLHGYYISSSIGTPPQHINLLIDTGSSNLAVVTSHNVQNEHFFNYNHSLTFRPTTTEVQLTYIQGFWKGFIGLDIFNPCFEQDCSIVCNISCMYFLYDIFDNNSQFQGILGLAYTSIAYPNSSIRPFLDVFFEEKNVTKIFALSLCGPFFSSKELLTPCGQLHIGYYSRNYFVGDILYTPILYEWFYEITVVNIKVDKFSIPLKCHELNKKKSIIDSGTTNLDLPLAAYQWVVAEIKNHVKVSALDHMWINESVVCMKKNIDISLFPTLALSLYHSDYKLFNIFITPESYLLPLSSNSCAMLAIGISNYGTVIGSSILKSFYVIFDRENKRIGFAKTKYLSNSKFESEISGILSDSSNLKDCIRIEASSETNFPAVLAAILVCLLFVTFCVLFPLLTWLWKYHIKKNHMDRSDIINLVDDE